MIDHLSIRTRPPGWPVMYQAWDKLLFLHWPMAAELLQTDQVYTCGETHSYGIGDRSPRINQQSLFWPGLFSRGLRIGIIGPATASVIMICDTLMT
jgi:hypothetical protein